MTNFTYNPPSGNISSSVDALSWINGLVDNWFFSGSILTLYFIILIKMLTNPNNSAPKSFAAASFICMIISVFARTMNFVSTGFMSIFIVLTAISGVVMHMENN